MGFADRVEQALCDRDREGDRLSARRTPPVARKPEMRAGGGTREFAALPMLTHFTRAAGSKSAIDNLDAILRSGVIRAATRLIRGQRPVVCLFDATVGELGRLLVRSNRRRYERFGVALDKRYAFAMGARPVLYLPWREARQILAEEEWWRVAAIELDRKPPIDWSFEREWRVAGDLPLPARAAVALVESWRDADELYDRFDGDPPCAGVIPIKDLPGFA